MSLKAKLGIVGALVVAIAAFFLRSRDREVKAPPTPAGSADSPTSHRNENERPSPPSSDSASALAADAEPTSPEDTSAKNVLVRARWGSGTGALGRDRQQEGNAEGPSSLVLAGKDLLVLDQVNGRLARYDAKGRLVGTTKVSTTVQDLAVGKDGTIAMVDRLVDKSVTLVNAAGKPIGTLPLEPNVEDPGLVTGVVVDGKNVYAEKEHGQLVLLGTTDGTPAEGQTELQGRPSKDGALLLSASLAAPAMGQAVVNAFDRKTEALRFARGVQFPAPAHGIVFLDSDAQGTIYLGVAAGGGDEAHVACLDRNDGHVVGRTVLALSSAPEESLRDVSVGDDGTIVFAVRSEEYVEYRTARCVP